MQTITVTSELTIEELRDTSWGQAPATIKRLTDTEIEIIFFTLEEISEGKPYSRTEVNDFFWFENEEIENFIGRKILWSEETAPESDEEIELVRRSSEYYDDLIEFWKNDLDFNLADKDILVSEYIRKEIGNDIYITEHAADVQQMMLKIFKERW